MKGQIRSGHTITDAFVYCLMGLFALAGVLVALLAAKVCRTVTDDAQKNTEQRLPAAFVRTFVRAADAKDGVYIGKENGIDVLTAREIFDGEEYLTRVYCYDGVMRTSLTAATEAFDPLLGDAICALAGMAFEEKDGLLTAELTDGEGITETVSVSIRSVREQ